jgi:hypothetical protein
VAENFSVRKSNFLPVFDVVTQQQYEVKLNEKSAVE